MTRNINISKELYVYIYIYIYELLNVHGNENQGDFQCGLGLTKEDSH